MAGDGYVLSTVWQSTQSENSGNEGNDGDDGSSGDDGSDGSTGTNGQSGAMVTGERTIDGTVYWFGNGSDGTAGVWIS